MKIIVKEGHPLSGEFGLLWPGKQQRFHAEIFEGEEPEGRHEKWEEFSRKHGLEPAKIVSMVTIEKATENVFGVEERGLHIMLGIENLVGDSMCISYTLKQLVAIGFQMGVDHANKIKEDEKK